jgi:hypothetical protein
MAHYCKECGSQAINHQLHGRDGTDDDLCDVCYWRKRASQSAADSELLNALDANWKMHHELKKTEQGWRAVPESMLRSKHYDNLRAALKALYLDK